jgi:hypothetical protein
MTLKDIRNRINKKIDERYKERQKIITKIKDYLNIDFNKISVYKTEISIKKNNTVDRDGQKETNEDYVLFKVEIPSSIIASSRFYYKGVDIDSLTVENAKNLEKDLEYILNQLEKEIDNTI